MATDSERPPRSTPPPGDVAPDTPIAKPQRLTHLRRHGPAMALAGIIALHLVLTLHFAPPEVIFSDQPTYAIDFALHYYQVDSARQNFEQSGRLWGYDPLMLAGHPIGAIEDLSSKSLELWVIALTRLGVSQGQAFNLYVLLVHLLLPLCALASAWLFRLTRWQRVFLLLGWVLLWFFDSLFHWLWFCGMVSWAAASYLIPVQLGLLYRAFEEQKRRYWLASLITASFLALIHPFAALTLAFPVLALYVRDFHTIRRTSHVAFFATVAAAAGVATIWLLPALSMKQYILQTDDFLRPGPLYAISDFFDITYDVAQTGMPVRTMIRTLLLVSGAVSLYQLKTGGDRRFLPLAFASGAALLLAYAGGLLWITRQTQPYRQIAPAILLASLAAIPLLGNVLAPSAIRAASPPIRLALLLAAILLVPRLARTIVNYFPQALPTNSVGSRAALGDVAAPPPRPMKLVSPPADGLAVRAWLRAHLKPGRVLIEDYMLAEFMAATTDLPILGGLAQRAIPQADSHLFRLEPNGALTSEQLRAYLERFAVRYIVITNLKRKLEWNRDLLSFRKLLGRHRIYETKARADYFMLGSGRIVGQRMNSIRVAEAKPAMDRIVLRFHWLETLRCRAIPSGRPCPLSRYPIKGARTGFIRITSPPQSFEIYNSYRLGKTKWRGSRARLPEL